jgi:type VI secretion system protein VasG
MAVNLRSLVGKLNDTTRATLESAAGLCLSRTHYNLEIEHFLMRLLDSSGADMACLLRHFEVDRARMAAELSRALDKLKHGSSRPPALSLTIVKMLTEAWVIASIDFGSGQIRTGYAVLALLNEPELARIVHEASPEMTRINPDVFKKEFATIMTNSLEDARDLETAVGLRKMAATAYFNIPPGHQL